MKPHDFIAKWSDSKLRERAAAHSHFIDLCMMLGEQAPTDADPKGEWYAFEKGASKTGGGDGWADVWKRGCFAWEYKSPGKDLNAALKQLQYYVRSLESPPLLIVSDMYRIELHTNWTNTVQQAHTLVLEELADARQRQKLKWAFSDSDVNQLRPGQTRDALTKEVAEDFVELAQSLRERGHDPEKVAHFINRMVFCMFAEDVDLLPDKMFKRMLQASADAPEKFLRNAQLLFAAMKKGGEVGYKSIDWFNGGIFDDDTALPLTKADINVALTAANKNWSNIDPSIMGTLFERGLDPDKRSQLGAHYTDPDKIMLIVNPVIVEPFTREWEEIKPKIEDQFAKAKAAKEARPPNQKVAARFHQGQRQREENARRAAREQFDAYIETLRSFRVLDPACGSGNFLYLALKALKDIEQRANIDFSELSKTYDVPVGVFTPVVGPENVKGIEINPFAAELARVSVWIGEIQWMREHGLDAARNPILKPLDTIECRDALLNGDGTEADWPEADAIIGNPPFLGAKKHASVFDEQYLAQLRRVYADRVLGLADLVTYWFVRTGLALRNRTARSAGLVATNSIRDGANLQTIAGALESLSIFDAYSDQPWIVEGASVRVSIVCFAPEHIREPHLDGAAVTAIGTDLLPAHHGAAFNRAVAARLKENNDIAFIGIQKNGDFDVEGTIARGWLLSPSNPGSHNNNEVLRPLISGRDLTGRARDRWIIDFFPRTERDAALFEEPFKHCELVIKPERLTNNRESRRRSWWWFGEVMPKMRAKTAFIQRFLATSLTSKYRIFTWLPPQMLCDSTTVVIARDDDLTFGVLQSRLHQVWSLRMGAWLGVGNDPRYTPTTCFETFPFPEGLTPNIASAKFRHDQRGKTIAAAAAQLYQLRENWLNPPDLVQRIPEVVQGFPDRTVPLDDKAAAILKKRTLTNLYNERPTWLNDVHKELDASVAAAYGWTADLSDDQILEKLFKLNQHRAAPI